MDQFLSVLSDLAAGSGKHARTIRPLLPIELQGNVTLSAAGLPSRLQQPK